jgi:hypothetical protein
VYGFKDYVGRNFPKVFLTFEKLQIVVFFYKKTKENSNFMLHQILGLSRHTIAYHIF